MLAQRPTSAWGGGHCRSGFWQGNPGREVVCRRCVGGGREARWGRGRSFQVMQLLVPESSPESRQGAEPLQPLPDSLPLTHCPH